MWRGFKCSRQPGAALIQLEKTHRKEIEKIVGSLKISKNCTNTSSTIFPETLALNVNRFLAAGVAIACLIEFTPHGNFSDQSRRLAPVKGKISPSIDRYSLSGSEQLILVWWDATFRFISLEKKRHSTLITKLLIICFKFPIRKSLFLPNISNLLHVRAHSNSHQRA